MKMLKKNRRRLKKIQVDEAQCFIKIVLMFVVALILFVSLLFVVIVIVNKTTMNESESKKQQLLVYPTTISSTTSHTTINLDNKAGCSVNSSSFLFGRTAAGDGEDQEENLNNDKARHQLMRYYPWYHFNLFINSQDDVSISTAGYDGQRTNRVNNEQKNIEEALQKIMARTNSYNMMRGASVHLRNEQSSSSAMKTHRRAIISDQQVLEDRDGRPLTSIDLDSTTVPITKHKLTDNALNYYFTEEIFGSNTTDDIYFLADNLCYDYLLSFLKGITDAKDNCDGIKNAYTGAFCEEADKMETDDDHDDYFVKYNHFSCCKALKSHFNAYCGKSKVYACRYLLIGAIILLLCEVTKNIIRLQKLHWMPEVGGCIIVGLVLGAVCHILHDVHIDDYSFDEILFLHILLPPILFDAALSMNKRQFCRFRLAIFIMAIVGTMLSMFITGFIVYIASHNILSVTSLPLLDSLLFGALISSTDPAAISSILASSGFSENDIAYIIVIGESLLNDSVAISFFNAFVSHYEYEGTDADEILHNFATFLYTGFGSFTIGLCCGILALLYFWLFYKRLNSCMEVACFFLWAGLSYYISEEMHMSGIISIVTTGFFMDSYIVSRTISEFNTDSANTPADVVEYDQELPLEIPASTSCNSLGSPSVPHFHTCSLLDTTSEGQTLQNPDLEKVIYQKEKFHLSKEAEKHVRFVSHLLAQLSENCIFVYLGLFLYSENYEWQAPLIIVSILSCVFSRVVMVFIVCNLVWYINKFRQTAGCYRPKCNSSCNGQLQQNSRTASSLQNRHIQSVIVLSGLRGAVSFSLVESLPIYNLVTDEGTKYKGIVKAMTSSSILFTIFILGGSSYYIIKYLGKEPFEGGIIRDQSYH
jgi:NhaP-type Na+/H+ or K+/H+ antiporter